MEVTAGLKRWRHGLVVACVFLLAAVSLDAERGLSTPTRPSAEPLPQARTELPSGLAVPEGRISLRALAETAGLELSALRNSGRVVLERGSATRVEFTEGSREIQFNGFRIFLGEPVRSYRHGHALSLIDYESLLRPLLAPRSLRVPHRPTRTIVLDPGHGGSDPGTRNVALGLAEKDMVLDVARRLRELLEADGYRVILTREDDRFVSLEQRARIANRTDADLFISIHFNAVEDSAVHGTETFLLTPRHHRSTAQGAAASGDTDLHPGNEYDHWNAVLAYLVQRRMLHDLRSLDRGIKRARFSVLREVDCPAVLVEAGYLSNPAEARRIGSPAYRERLARSLALAVHDFERTLASPESAF